MTRAGFEAKQAETLILSLILHPFVDRQPTVPRLFASLAELMHRSAAIVVALSVLTTIAAAWYAIEDLTIYTDTGSMIASDVPFRKDQDDFKSAFPQLTDVLLILVEAPTRGHANDVARALGSQLRSNEKLVRAVDFAGGDPFFRKNGLLYLDTDELERLSQRLAEAQPLLATLHGDPTLRGLASILGDVSRAAVERQAEIPVVPVFDSFSRVTEARLAERSDRVEWQTFFGGTADVAEDNQTTRVLLVVQPRLDYSQLLPAKDVLAAVRAAAQSLPPDLAEGVRVRITGAPAIANDEINSARSGAETSAVLSLIAIAVILAFALGSFSLVLSAVCTLVMGLIWTAAFGAAVVGHLNLISVAFVVLFVGVGGDFSILWALRVREEIDRGRKVADAIKEAALGTGDGLLLGTLTAAAGFLAFVPTEYLGLAELGIISGASMFIGLFLTVTVMPAMTALMPPKRRQKRAGEAASAALGAWIRRRAGPVVIGATAIGLVSAFLATRSHFDYDPINLRDPHAEATIAFRDLARDPSTSPYTMSALAPSLDEARNLAARLEALPSIDRAVTLADYVPKDQEEKLRIIDDMQVFMTPLLMEAPPPKPLAPGEGAKVLRGLRADLDQVTRAETVAPELRQSAARLERALRDYLQKFGGSDASIGRPCRSIHRRPAASARRSGANDPTEQSRDRRSARIVARAHGGARRAYAHRRASQGRRDRGRAAEALRARRAIGRAARDRHAGGYPRGRALGVAVFRRCRCGRVRCHHHHRPRHVAKRARLFARAGPSSSRRRADRGYDRRLERALQFRERDRSAAAIGHRGRRRDAYRIVVAPRGRARFSARHLDAQRRPVQLADHARLVRHACAQRTSRNGEHGHPPDRRDLFHPFRDAGVPSRPAALGARRARDRESSSLRAVILAAGVGNRIAAAHTGPKALLRFGGRSLLERHLGILKETGVDDIVIGTGYRSDEIAAELARIGAHHVRCVHNPRFRDGSVTTLWSLRDAVLAAGDVLVMDADVLYDRRMIQRLTSSRHDNCLLLDRDFLPGDEPVKICLRGGQIVEFRKKVEVQFDEVGESVGFFRFAPDTARILIETAGAYVENGRANAPHEEAIRDIVLATPAAFRRRGRDRASVDRNRFSRRRRARRAGRAAPAYGVRVFFFSASIRPATVPPLLRITAANSSRCVTLMLMPSTITSTIL